MERALAITGRLDLVHANASKDTAGSGRDRHENFGSGQIDPDVLVEGRPRRGSARGLRDAGRGRGQAADIAFLRDRLPR